MTSLPEISLRRPVLAWMLMLGLVLFGIISFFRLGVSQLPDVDFPVLNVSVLWEGAAPEVMEAEIVDRLEQTITLVEGIREISSSIRQGRATITVEFGIDRDIDAALQEVQSAISQVRLPLDVDPPTIRKNNPEDQPILWLGVVSPTRPLRDLIEYVDLYIRDQFQILPGVGEVVLGGFTERNLRIWVRNESLEKYQLSILDVRDALQRGHIEAAAGIIENQEQELNLRVLGEGQNPAEVGEMLISSRGGRPIFGSPIRLKDVARVEDGLADVRRLSQLNGIPGVGLGIRKMRGSNAVEIGKLVRQRVETVQSQLPKDMIIKVNFDSTLFVKEAIEETEFTLLLSALVTGVVCWLFLGSLRPTLNILISIPVSIIGTFTVIYFMGFTLNMFTILGLALAIGIVVDDAIMVLENIYRHRAMGKSAFQAALDGTKEIQFAAMAATVAVIAIFLPVAFMDGVIGKFFWQFGVTITVAVALSLLEALTLMPVRSAALVGGQGPGRLEALVDLLCAKLAQGYRVVLAFCLRMRLCILLASFLIFYLSMQIVPKLRKEFIPPQDQGVFLVRMETAVGSSLTHTNTILRAIDEKIRERSSVERTFAAAGGFSGGEVNSGIMFVTLKDRSTGRDRQEKVMQDIRQEFSEMKEARLFLQDLTSRGLTAQRGFPVELSIRGRDWEILREKSEEIATQIRASGLAVDVNTDYRIGQPEIQVQPLRAEASARGVEIQTIVDTVASAIGGVRQGKFTKDGRRYDVRLRLEGEERIRAEDIFSLSVRNVYGELVPIKEVIRIETLPTLQTIARKNRERAISIYGNVAPGKSQAEALEVSEELARQALPEGYRVVLGGGAQSFQESFQSLIFVLWLGLAVSYMILASQFNSYVDPFIVLLALPFSLTGAFAALWLGDQSLNLYSMIGIVLLMGIVKKNSILLVEFTNQKRHEGMDANQALLVAGPLRLRPILMTSAATLAAALPPALALGPGAESRIPMSLAILGGVTVSTLFTLFVVPCAYSLLARVRHHKKHAGTALRDISPQ